MRKERTVNKFRWVKGNIKVSPPPKKKSALDLLSEVKGR